MYNSSHVASPRIRNQSLSSHISKICSQVGRDCISRLGQRYPDGTVDDAGLMSQQVDGLNFFNDSTTVVKTRGDREEERKYTAEIAHEILGGTITYYKR